MGKYKPKYHGITEEQIRILQNQTDLTLTERIVLRKAVETFNKKTAALKKEN